MDATSVEIPTESVIEMGKECNKSVDYVTPENSTLSNTEELASSSIKEHSLKRSQSCGDLFTIGVDAVKKDNNSKRKRHPTPIKLRCQATLEALYQNTALHEKLAENINQVIKEEEYSSTDTELQKQLEAAVESIIEKTEADPIFELILEEAVVGHYHAFQTPVKCKNNCTQDEDELNTPFKCITDKCCKLGKEQNTSDKKEITDDVNIGPDNETRVVMSELEPSLCVVEADNCDNRNKDKIGNTSDSPVVKADNKPASSEKTSVLLLTCQLDSKQQNAVEQVHDNIPIIVVDSLDDLTSVVEQYKVKTDFEQPSTCGGKTEDQDDKSLRSDVGSVLLDQTTPCLHIEDSSVWSIKDFSDLLKTPLKLTMTQSVGNDDLETPIQKKYCDSTSSVLSSRKRSRSAVKKGARLDAEERVNKLEESNNEIIKSIIESNISCEVDNKTDNLLSSTPNKLRICTDNRKLSNTRPSVKSRTRDLNKSVIIITNENQLKKNQKRKRKKDEKVEERKQAPATTCKPKTQSLPNIAPAVPCLCSSSLHANVILTPILLPLAQYTLLQGNAQALPQVQVKPKPQRVLKPKGELPKETPVQLPVKCSKSNMRKAQKKLSPIILQDCLSSPKDMPFVSFNATPCKSDSEELNAPTESPKKSTIGSALKSLIFDTVFEQKDTPVVLPAATKVEKVTPANEMSINTKRMSLSTPRRLSHVRALDFETPADNPEVKRANTSPKSSKPNLNLNFIGQCKVSLFQSPAHESTPVKPQPKVKKKGFADWDRELRKFIVPESTHEFQKRLEAVSKRKDNEKVRERRKAAVQVEKNMKNLESKSSLNVKEEKIESVSVKKEIKVRSEGNTIKSEIRLPRKKDPNLEKKSGKEIIQVKKEPVLSETSSEEESPVKKKAIVEEETPVKKKKCTAKKTPVKKRSPVKKATPVRKRSPVKKATPVKKRSPIKKATPVKKRSPVKKATPVKKRTRQKKETCVKKQTFKTPEKEATPNVAERTSSAKKKSVNWNCRVFRDGTRRSSRLSHKPEEDLDEEQIVRKKLTLQIPKPEQSDIKFLEPQVPLHKTNTFVGTKTPNKLDVHAQFEMDTPLKELIEDKSDVDTPFTKLIKDTLLAGPMEFLSTPIFPPTPNITLTPGNNDVSPARPTDYSSGSSYYKPDITTPLKLQNVLNNSTIKEEDNVDSTQPDDGTPTISNETLQCLDESEANLEDVLSPGGSNYVRTPKKIKEKEKTIPGLVTEKQIKSTDNEVTSSVEDGRQKNKKSSHVEDSSNSKISIPRGVESLIRDFETSDSVFNGSFLRDFANLHTCSNTEKVKTHEDTSKDENQPEKSESIEEIVNLDIVSALNLRRKTDGEVSSSTSVPQAKKCKITDFFTKINDGKQTSLKQVQIDDILLKARQTLQLQNCVSRKRLMTGKNLSMAKMQMLAQCDVKLVENIPLSDESISCEQPVAIPSRLLAPDDENASDTGLFEKVRMKMKQSSKCGKIFDEMQEKRRKTLDKLKKVDNKDVGKVRAVKRKAHAIEDEKEKKQEDADATGNIEVQTKLQNMLMKNYTEAKLKKLMNKYDLSTVIEFDKVIDVDDELLLDKTAKKLKYCQKILELPEIKKCLDNSSTEKQKLVLANSTKLFFDSFYVWLKRKYERSCGDHQFLIKENLDKFKLVETMMREPQNEESKIDIHKLPPIPKLPEVVQNQSKPQSSKSNLDQLYHDYIQNKSFLSESDDSIISHDDKCFRLTPLKRKSVTFKNEKVNQLEPRRTKRVYNKESVDDLKVNQLPSEKESNVVELKTVEIEKYLNDLNITLISNWSANIYKLYEYSEWLTNCTCKSVRIEKLRERTLLYVTCKRLYDLELEKKLNALKKAKSDLEILKNRMIVDSNS